MGLSKTQVSELYVAIFNRAGEGGGNAFWRSKELSKSEIITAMLDTTDSKEYFGSALDTNQAFIEHIYQNTLNKTITDDPDGVAYWTNLLDSEVPRGEVVEGLIDAIASYAPGGANYDADNTLTVAAYNQFINRVAVSDYTADNLADAPADYKDRLGFDKDLIVTDDDVTSTAAQSKVVTLSYESTDLVFTDVWLDGKSGYSTYDKNSDGIFDSILAEFSLTNGDYTAESLLTTFTEDGTYTVDASGIVTLVSASVGTYYLKGVKEITEINGFELIFSDDYDYTLNATLEEAEADGAIDFVFYDLASAELFIA